MATRIRLKRLGRRNKPFYRIIVIDSKKRRDGAAIEEVGWYDPILKKDKNFILEEDRILHWLSQGAQPTDIVKNMMKKTGLSHRWHLIRLGLSDDEIERNMQKWQLDRELTLKQREEKELEKSVLKKKEAEKEKEVEEEVKVAIESKDNAEDSEEEPMDGTDDESSEDKETEAVEEGSDDKSEENDESAEETDTVDTNADDKSEEEPMDGTDDESSEDKETEAVEEGSDDKSSELKTNKNLNSKKDNKSSG
ncbi:MAG TPA: 30S ribosomal protein S16 [Candidatus Marinimicrobia bacterium]|nr:30S ribosomal protein S16 [Candidatus Neomarinimicrobiota bacterium]